jgi:hypothetical protein
MLQIRTVRGSMLAGLLVVGLMAGLGTLARAADDIDAKAVARAHNFLKTKQRGRDVLGFVHLGTRYKSHSYKATHYVNRAGKRVPGHFALVYTFKWAEDGETNVGFLCDARGTVYQVQIVDTNAEINQPFAVADLAIKALGNLFIEAFKDELTQNDKKVIQKLVDDADARGLLELSLRFQQKLGR